MLRAGGSHAAGGLPFRAFGPLLALRPCPSPGNISSEFLILKTRLRIANNHVAAIREHLLVHLFVFMGVVLFLVLGGAVFFGSLFNFLKQQEDFGILLMIFGSVLWPESVFQFVTLPLPGKIIALAAGFESSACRVGVLLRSPEAAQKVADGIRNGLASRAQASWESEHPGTRLSTAKKSEIKDNESARVTLLTGQIRGHERDKLL